MTMLPVQDRALPLHSQDRSETRQLAPEERRASAVSRQILSHAPQSASVNAPAEMLRHVRYERDAATLLKLKLADPSIRLSAEESIKMIMECLELGKRQACEAEEKHLIVLLGNTGVGKSTFGNYLLDCEMQRVSPNTIRMMGDDKIVIVRSKGEGGRLDEIMPIGHSKKSMTFMPQIAGGEQGLFFCDCPGFLDNRGFEINVANAVNTRMTFINAKSLRIVILINYHSLLADRARGFSEMLAICGHLFGSKDNLMRYMKSLLIGIAQVPLTSERAVEPKKEIKVLQDFFADTPSRDPFEKHLLLALSKRIFIFDPVDPHHLAYHGAWDRQQILEQISLLEPVEPAHVFKTVLTGEDEAGLLGICETIKTNMRVLFEQDDISEDDYRQAAKFQESLNQLENIDHPRVHQLISNARALITDHFKERVWRFDRLCQEETLRSFQQAQRLLKHILNALQFFDDTVKQAVNGFIACSSQQAETSQIVQATRNFAVQNQRLTQKMQVLVFAANEEVRRLGESLGHNLREFSNQSSQLSQSLRSLVQQLESEMEQASLIPGNRLQRVWSLFKLSSHVLEIISDSSFHCLALERKASELGLKSFQGVLELALYARKLEIDYLNTQLVTLTSQGDHEWLISIKIHTQKMKEETQKFNQLLQIEEIRSQEKERKINQKLDKLQLGLQELSQRDELLAQEQLIYLRHQDQLCCLRIRGLDEAHAIDVGARHQMAEILSQYSLKTNQTPH